MADDAKASAQTGELPPPDQAEQVGTGAGERIIQPLRATSNSSQTLSRDEPVFDSLEEAIEYIVRVAQSAKSGDVSVGTTAEGQHVRDVVILIGDFFEAVERSGLVHIWPGSATSLFTAAELGALIYHLRKTLRLLAGLEYGGATDAILVEVQAAARRLIMEALTFLDRNRALVVDKASEDQLGPGLVLFDSTSERLQAKRLVFEVQAARDEAVRVLDETKQAAGTTGTYALSHFFGKYGDEQRVVAGYLRISVIAILLGIAALAGFLLFMPSSDSGYTLQEVARLSVVVPLGILAAYLSRQSSAHRAASDWSRELEIQLQTLEAFTQPLDEEERRKYRAALGNRIFSARASKSLGNEVPPTVLAEVTDLLAKASEILKSTKSGAAQ